MPASKDRVCEVLALLCDRFPKTFFMYQGRRRPLKIGIRADLEAALGDTVDARMLRRALRRYVVNVCYLASQLAAGAERIDLLGEPAGAVTEAESQNARKAIAGLRAKKKAKPKPVPKPEPPPARDSLSALREAARKRREMASAGGGA